MIRKPILAACVIGTVAAGGIFAAKAQDTKTFTLGYSVGFLTDPFQAIQAGLFMKSAKATGLQALPVANANGDAGRQNTDIHNLIGQGAKGLIIVATDSGAIVPALNYAASKNVPVVSIDIGPAGGKAAMIVRANNLRMGEDACKSMGKSLGGKGTVLSLLGDQATINGRDRTTGFKTCMSKEFPGITVLEQPTYWKTEKATAAAQTVLTTTPALSGIYMQSDGVMLAGILNVLKSAGKLTKAGTPNHMYLVSIDGTPAALKAVRDGLVDTVISQPLDLYVKYGLAYLQAAVAGKTFAEGKTDHDSDIVVFNGNPMDLLPAPIVTAANAADPNLWGNAAK